MECLLKKGHRPSGTIGREQEHDSNAEKNRRECLKGERPRKLFVGEGKRLNTLFGDNNKRHNTSFSDENDRTSTLCVDNDKRPNELSKRRAEIVLQH